MAEKEFEMEDPFEMRGISLPVADADAYYEEMGRTFVEEYALMGWRDEAILDLFRSPFYQGAHLVLEIKGEEFVKNLIRGVRHG